MEKGISFDNTNRKWKYLLVVLDVLYYFIPILALNYIRVYTQTNYLLLVEKKVARDWHHVQVITTLCPVFPGGNVPADFLTRMKYMIHRFKNQNHIKVPAFNFQCLFSMMRLMMKDVQSSQLYLNSYRIYSYKCNFVSCKHS